MGVAFNAPEIDLNGLTHGQLPILGDVNKLAVVGDKEIEPVCFKLPLNKRMFRGDLGCEIDKGFTNFR